MRRLCRRKRARQRAKRREMAEQIAIATLAEVGRSAEAGEVVLEALGAVVE